jgi:AcrR family transcriptional regulator
MPKISGAQRDARREEILAAALRCFSRDGFHQTTTGDIVRESGVSQGTLYLYFKSKDDLIEALAQDRHRIEVLMNSLAEHEQEPAAALQALLRLYFGYLCDPDRADVLRVGMQGWAEALRNERIRRSVLEGLAIARSSITRVIARGQRKRVFRRNMDPAAMADMLIALFQGFVLQAAWEPKRDLAPALRAVADSVRMSLESRAAAGG